MFESMSNPKSISLLERFGFRFGDKGTHSSRTIMFHDLQSLLVVISVDSAKVDYDRAVLEDNCLGKQTLSTRKLSLQRLAELYALDLAVPLFRIMRNLWDVNPESQPQLTLLTALARDPLLRLTVTPVVTTPAGKEFSRQSMTDALETGTSSRFNDATLDKIVRNCSSSWTQSGHLEGRARKFRRLIRATPSAAAYAMLLGYLQGFRGQNLFNCPWIKVLDLDEMEARERADDAKRLGLLDIKQSGSIIDISFPKLLTETDKELLYGAD